MKELGSVLLFAGFAVSLLVLADGEGIPEPARNEVKKVVKKLQIYSEANKQDRGPYWEKK